LRRAEGDVLPRRKSMHSDTLSHDHLPDLIIRRPAIEAAMAQYLAGLHQGVATEQDKSAAHRLFDALLDGLNGGGEAPPLDDAGLRRHASRFGDGLSPILKDALGPDVPDAFIARCVDRYWRVLQGAAA
jgi:hypothetical protein